MYEELVKKIRNCTDKTIKNCIDCPYHGGYKNTYCMNGLITEAADAIEKLNRKVEDFEAVREISPEAEYAINKHTDNLISKLNELISDSEEKPCWIPVIERLPEEKLASYLCFTDDGYCHEVRWTNCLNGLIESDKWAWNIFDIPQFSRVTHWMPLPAPPKEEAK